MSLLTAAGLCACDGGPHPPDAQARPVAESAEVSVRFDTSSGKPTTVQVLAFRATTTVTAGERADVLGIVDPLAAAAPEQGCALRDVDGTTAALLATGGSIELQEMSGIGVGLGLEALLRPSPRLYPDVATAVGGVVAETGPQTVATLPEHVSLYTADLELPVADLALPPAPRLIAVDGLALIPGAQARVGIGVGVGVAGQDVLAVTVGNAAGGLIELRPFGATESLACAVPTTAPSEAVVVIPRALMARLLGPRTSAAPVAASLEVARRTRLRQSMPGAATTRISVEVRAASTVELRP